METMDGPSTRVRSGSGPGADERNAWRSRSFGDGVDLLNSFAARVLDVVAGLVIARVVSPNEFGTYTVALLVMAIVLSMNEAGLSVAVIRWKEGVDRVTPTAVSCSLASSAAWFRADVLRRIRNRHAAERSRRDHPDPCPLRRRPARRHLHDPNALLMRAFQQRRRAAAQLSGFLVGSPIGILLASKSGASGLAVGMLIANAVSTSLILWLAPAHPRPGWERGTAVNLIRLGLRPALTSVLLLTIVNVDSIVVSRVLGVGRLGSMRSRSTSRTGPGPVVDVDPRRCPTGLLTPGRRPGWSLGGVSHSLTLAAGLAVLGGVLLASLAEPVVGILYGSKWLPAVVALQWLALLGALRVILELSYDLLVAVRARRRLGQGSISWLAASSSRCPSAPTSEDRRRRDSAGNRRRGDRAAAQFPTDRRIGLRLAVLYRSLQPVAVAALVGCGCGTHGAAGGRASRVTLLGAGALITLAYAATFLSSRRGRAALRWAVPPSIPSPTPPSLAGGERRRPWPGPVTA